MGNCKICAAQTKNNDEYHPRCSRKFYGSFPAPVLDISLENIAGLAAKSVLTRTTVAGVQKKLSLSIEKKDTQARFTTVGLWGTFILKPPSGPYPGLPENEHTIMRIASSIGIRVVPHALIRLASGELSYISRRIDRDKNGEKIAMEDFCQISGRLTEDKYKGSMERIGKLLRTFSVFPGIDAVDLFERVLFSFICGNSDMHLKNYSLLETPQGMRLSPAYDLVSTVLAIPDDPEESALTINGKKTNLTKRDFDSLAQSLHIPLAAMENSYHKMAGNRETMHNVVKSGFLPEPKKQDLLDLIDAGLRKFI
jgi:serine/threonine-protein kinase HipA